MFNQTELGKAVTIQKSAYQLLLWMQEGIKQGFISFESAEHYTTFSDSAFHWIDEHYNDIPLSCRPDRSDIKCFANYFSSYLSCSFELIQSPGKKKATDGSCFCPMCCYWVDMPHLKTKKVRSADKKTAHKKICDYLSQLTLENNVELTEEKKTYLLKEFKEEVALCTYGVDLLKRLQGNHNSSSFSLVLWRTFAWTREGSPIHNFELDAMVIINCEEKLRSLF